MTTSDDAYMTPQGLLQRIHDEREALAATWGALTMEQLVQRPGPQDDWSVKDLIAHVTRWESFILQRVTDLMDGVPSKPAEPHDVLNARAYRQNRDRPLAEVLAAFDANWPRLVMLLTSLNEEQLNAPAYYPTYDGVALLPILRAGTYGHYPSHMTDLRTYAARLASRPEGEGDRNQEL